MTNYGNRTRKCDELVDLVPIILTRILLAGPKNPLQQVLSGYAVSVVVTCGEETGQVREVSMTVEDMDGAAVSGKDNLVILMAAMQGKKRRRRGNEEEEAERKYKEYRQSMRMRKESRMRREGILDLCCTAFGALVFLAFLMLLAFR